jgi:hypothetical protein
MIKRKPYYQTFGSFELVNSDSFAEKKGSRLEGMFRDQQVLIDMGDVYDQLSSIYDGFIELTLTEKNLHIKHSVPPIKLVMTSKNLMHLLSDNSFILDKTLTSENSK